MKKLLLTVTIVALLGACASHTDEIPAAYVSPIEYQDYSCRQLSAEITRVSRRAQEVAYAVDKNASGDSTTMAVGLILFWPALFFIDGDTPQAQEYGRLKGQFDAIEQMAIQKNCGLKVKENPFDKIEKQRREQQKSRKTTEKND